MRVYITIAYEVNEQGEANAVDIYAPFAGNHDALLNLLFQGQKMVVKASLQQPQDITPEVQQKINQLKSAATEQASTSSEEATILGEVAPNE